ncbi:hypothetical protein [Aegicerativicinus sediminis]
MDLPKTIEDFQNTLGNENPPESWSLQLKCLWYDANNEWQKAHDIAQNMDNMIGSWLHAYLHRVEGDQWNADYWYRKANRKSPKNSLDEEFENILNYILSNK